MNIIPKEFRRLQEFQHVVIPSTRSLYSRAKGVALPRPTDSVSADFTSRNLDKLSESVYEVENMLRERDAQSLEDYNQYVESTEQEESPKHP